MRLIPVGTQDLRRSFVLAIDRRPSLDALLQRSGARNNSYAGKIICDLHEAVFTSSLDLVSDYETFYAVEYGSFRKYAHRRFLFTKEVLDELEREFLRCKELRFFHGYGIFGNEDTDESLLEDILEFQERKK